MKASPARLIIYGQSCLVLGLLLCIIIRPHGLTVNEGISYYGTFGVTILPYFLALLGAAVCSVLAAGQPAVRQLPVLRGGLLISSLLVACVALTPDTWGRLLGDVHELFGAVLFSLQLVLSGWLVVRLRYAPWAVLLTALELAGGIASFIWLAPPQGYLLESQLFFQLSFGGLLVYALNRLQL